MSAPVPQPGILDIAAYVDGHVERFREDIRSRVSRFIGD